MNNNIGISIALISYNQEKYIEQAIQGIVKQKVSFPIEVIVGDDCSTDQTYNIIKKYEAQLPNPLWLNSGVNIGMHKNWERVIKAAKGNYIALLEGDDYWQDEFKLQKQYDVLEADEKRNISFTNADVTNELNDGKSFEMYVDGKKTDFDLADLLRNNFIPTCSVVFRNNLPLQLPREYFQSPYVDWIIHLLSLRDGKIHFLNEKTSVYRLHEGGVFGGSHQVLQQKRKIKVLELITKMFPDNQKGLIDNIKKEYDKLIDSYKNSGDYSNYLKHKLKKIMV